METTVEDLATFADSPDADRLLAEVRDHDLPPVLDELVEASQAFEWTRDRFMWQWVHRLAPANTLPCVDEAYRDAVPTDKTIAILFVTLLDDVLEKRRDRATFGEASKLPFEHRRVDWDREGLDREYVEFAERVWETLVRRIERAPRYEEYLRLFLYDVKQAINAIDYSEFVIEHPSLATLHDLELYQSHNMVMHAYADIDLMHSSVDLGSELSALREAVWCAQQMARIGNWVSTWERELAEGDYSSGILVCALEEEIVTAEELEALGPRPDEAALAELAGRIEDHDLERRFLRRWQGWRDELVAIDAGLEAVDLGPFIEGLEEVLRFHLASRGLK